MRHHWGRFVFAAFLAAMLSPARAAFAAGDLKATLAQLDATASHFHTTNADVEFDTVQTDPVPDKDVQKGVVYYKRSGSSFQMGVHITSDNGQKLLKTIVCCEGGTVKLYEQQLNQVTVLSKLSQYENYFMLGFGASGKELAEKWTITDDGPERMNGVQTEKLTMIPKDAAVRRNLPKVTLWMDLQRGVSLKQLFDEGPGQYRVALYTNIKINQSIPSDAFTLKTNKQTTVVKR